ncbi:flavin reductase family protein [Sedimenticola sp.]|uniref:flavin reductase family protein n=1 Tax=Sedimenticola sp. TaxID=1940285 RepID=UPI00258FD888|nr:flavin reductase family protein [Sedimenticola sp.]MCW8902663.1 flavin reductase family protein [Sedimenticola sp.]
MIIDLDDLSTSETYFAMTQAIIPRPIAWVLSENRAGDYNLAPFSYFNAVCSDPPLIMISLGKKPDGTPKDTRVNIEARGSFVVHIAGVEQIQPLNASSATLPSGESEITHLGLELAEFPGSRLPRLAECRLAMACELYEVMELGPVPQALVFGRLTHLYIEDGVAEQDSKGRLKIHADRLNPLGRLGAREYFAGGKIITLPRPA